MKYLFGTALSAEQRTEALTHFQNRYTGDHTPVWVVARQSNEIPPAVQFATDMEFLENSEFGVSEDGSMLTGHVTTHPTWPNNPELRKDVAAGK